MTELEATEEILRGPYSTCLKCGGRGHVTVMLEGGRNTMSLPSCKSCRGSGKWLRGDYRSACFILNLECPPIPTWEIKVGMDFGIYDKITFDRVLKVKEIKEANEVTKKGWNFFAQKMVVPHLKADAEWEGKGWDD